MKQTPLLSLMNEKYKLNSSEKNYAFILCGNVLVNGDRKRNPGEKIDINSEITITEKKYVSRGGIKLEHALRSWNIDAAGKGFLDAGSSTGGFTDCLLQNGALFVHSVDVGYNQIDYSLRNNSRVILHENTNIMLVDSLSPMPEIGTADLSFRSIVKAASKILDLVTEQKLIALIKPQFETDRSNLNKGVILNRGILEETLNMVIDRLFDEKSYVQAVLKSPVSGRKGNVEFLFLITREESTDKLKIKESLAGIIPDINN